jgi:hypothetical protein
MALAAAGRVPAAVMAAFPSAALAARGRRHPTNTLHPTDLPTSSNRMPCISNHVLTTVVTAMPFFPFSLVVKRSMIVFLVASE